MIRKIFAVVAVLALGGCATVGGTTTNDPIFPAAGPLPGAALNDAAAYTAIFSEEELAAQALIDTGGFSVRCHAGRQYVYRVGNHEAVVDGDCEGLEYLPTLVRRKVTSDDSSLLMVMGVCCGAVNNGVMLREDHSASAPLVAIPIDNLWMFGPFLAENRVVIVTGEISPTGCGMIRHDRELTLDWDRAHVASERELPSPPLTCDDPAAN
jgi:hypothetical protein